MFSFGSLQKSQEGFSQFDPSLLVFLCTAYAQQIYLELSAICLRAFSKPLSTLAILDVESLFVQAVVVVGLVELFLMSMFQLPLCVLVF